MTSSPVPHGSLWWEEPGLAYPTLEGELDVEVLVVGGGITGLTLAYTLAEHGALVGLLESGALAGAASGRNAGFIVASPSEPYQEMIALWGRAGARAVLETGRRTHERTRQLVASLSIACDYRASGSFRLATGDEEAADIRASIPAMKADGFPMDEVPISDAVPAHAAEFFTAAFFTRDDGEFHPIRFLRGVAQAAAAKGVRLFERSHVTGARWQGGLWEARTAGGVARARTLALCTNAYVPQLLPALGGLIVPHRGQTLATAPLQRVVAPRPSYAHWGYRYWRQTPEGRLVIGGWRETDRDAEVGYETGVTPRVQRGIEQGLKTLVPEGAPVEFRWAGTMGFARDGRPLVGWLDAEHHLAICAGFTGHGLGMAAACTLDLAALLAWKEAPGITSFDPSRFPELRQVREGVTALGTATG